MTTCKVFRFPSGQLAKRVPSIEVSCPAGASGRCPSITTVSCDRSQSARPTRQGWPRQEPAVHLRVPTRFTDSVHMAGFIDVCLHCWASIITFLTHTLFARMVCPWNSALGCSPRLTGMVCIVGAVFVYVSSSHGDLNQASRAVCRSLAPFSGVPVSAWLQPAHPAHPWACQAPMRDCTTCRQDVNILQRAW